MDREIIAQFARFEAGRLPFGDPATFLRLDLVLLGDLGPACIHPFLAGGLKLGLRPRQRVGPDRLEPLPLRAGQRHRSQRDVDLEDAAWMPGEGPWHPFDAVADDRVSFENQTLTALGSRDIDQRPFQCRTTFRRLDQRETQENDAVE